MEDENGVYMSDNICDSMKANVMNLLLEDDDLISAHILQRIFVDIESIRIRMHDQDEEISSYRRRALKAEFALKKYENKSE